LPARDKTRSNAIQTRSAFPPNEERADALRKVAFGTRNAPLALRNGLRPEERGFAAEEWPSA
jgi:hypothetical protein